MAEHEADRDDSREPDDRAAPPAAPAPDASALPSPDEPAPAGTDRPAKERPAADGAAPGATPAGAAPTGGTPAGATPAGAAPTGAAEPVPGAGSGPGPSGGSADGSGAGEGAAAAGEAEAVAFDEEAAWAGIVAGYGEEPPDPPGAKPFKSVEDLALLDPEPNDSEAGGTRGRRPAGPDTDAPGPGSGKNDEDGDGEDGGSRDGGRGREAGSGRPLGGSVSFPPGVGPRTGPRDYAAPEPSEDDFDADDEGHFVPPEPPPLLTGDTTARFAWLAVIGGPILLLIGVLLGWEMTWWLATAGIGGFVGGFATLVVRMRGDEDEDDDPGRGAVV